jgi:hypothetical protein
MKFACGVVLLAFCTCALGSFSYIFPNAPCAWGVDIITNGTGLFKHERYYAYGRYFKIETYNYQEELVGATVGRPDIDNHGVFTYDGIGCSVNYDSDDWYGRTFQDALGNEFSLDTSTEFSYIDDAVYNGEKCMVYYKANPETKRPDKNYEAVFVNYNGQVIGYQYRLDDLEERKASTVTYFTYVPMSVFKFKKSYCYDAADERIFSNPDSYFAQCSASTNSIIFSTVFAFLIAALVLVF